MIKQNAGLLAYLPLPATLALAAVLVSACGSPARPAAAAAAATAKTCQQVSVTLGDSSAAKEAVVVASKRIHSLCRDAAS